jgi:hypothetical protein
LRNFGTLEKEKRWRFVESTKNAFESCEGKSRDKFFDFYSYPFGDQ